MILKAKIQDDSDLFVCPMKTKIKFKTLWKVRHGKICIKFSKWKFKSNYNVLSNIFFGYYSMKSSLIATLMGLVAANGSITTSPTPLGSTTTTTKYVTSSLSGKGLASSFSSGGSNDSRITTNNLINGFLASNGASVSGSSGSGSRFTSGGLTGGYLSGSASGISSSSS